MLTYHKVILTKFQEYAQNKIKSVQNHSPLPIRQYSEFTNKAKDIFLNQIQSLLPDIGPILTMVHPWLVSTDILSTAGIVYNENAYIKLIAWVLDPRTHLVSASIRQRAWLESIIPVSIELIEPVIPVLQFSTDDGVPDLVLRYNSFIVVIEAKTGSEEHSTPLTGLPQTVAYPAAVLRKYGLAKDFPVYIAFITPDGRKSANLDAINTTYVEFCCAIMKNLKIDVLPDELQFTFSLIFTHFLTCAIPEGINLRPLIEQYEHLDQKKYDEITLLSNFASILSFNNLLFPRRLP